MKGIEITHTTLEAETVVRELAQQNTDEILLGMGTLIKPEQAVTAKEAGADFFVSPIYEPELVKAMVESNLVSMAGALDFMHQALAQ